MLSMGFIDDVERDPLARPVGPPDRALLGHHAAPSPHAREEAAALAAQIVSVTPEDDHGRAHRAALARGRAARRSSTCSTSSCEPRSRERRADLRAHQDRRRRARRRPAGARPPRARDARRHDPGRARRASCARSARGAARASSSRPTSPRAGSTSSTIDARHQLRPAGRPRGVRPPHRPHRAGPAATAWPSARHHARAPQARRDRGAARRPDRRWEPPSEWTVADPRGRRARRASPRATPRRRPGRPTAVANRRGRRRGRQAQRGRPRAPAQH